MVVAGLLGHFVRDGPARALEIEHRDLRRQQRAFDPLPLARHLAFQERDQDAHRGEDAGREVGDRDADAHRPLPRQPGDRHEAAHALGDLVEARPVAVGAALAEPGDAGIDQARVDRLERGIVDAEPLLDVGAEILDHDIGIAHQLPKNLDPVR
jgi:hypothetical protein